MIIIPLPVHIVLIFSGYFKFISIHKYFLFAQFVREKIDQIKLSSYLSRTESTSKSPTNRTKLLNIASCYLLKFSNFSEFLGILGGFRISRSFVSKWILSCFFSRFRNASQKLTRISNFNGVVWPISCLLVSIPRKQANLNETDPLTC